MIATKKKGFSFSTKWNKIFYYQRTKSTIFISFAGEKQRNEHYLIKHSLMKQKDDEIK